MTRADHSLDPWQCTLDDFGSADPATRVEQFNDLQDGLTVRAEDLLGQLDPLGTAVSFDLAFVSVEGKAPDAPVIEERRHCRLDRRQDHLVQGPRGRRCQSGSPYRMKNHRSAAPEGMACHATGPTTAHNTWSAVAVPV